MTDRNERDRRNGSDNRDSQGPSEAELTSQAQLAIVKHHINFEPKSSGDVNPWQSMPELPTSAELNPNLKDKEQVEKLRSALLPNTVEKPWLEKNLYLETHYRLQREESITMLRFSIQKYKENPQMLDDEVTCVYTKVFVQGYLMTRLGPICRVRFSTERAGKRIRWNQTRRLTTGSLVALSTAKDRFRTICMPAVIADHAVRDGLDQNPPMIQFFWANNDDAVVDPTTELVMVETRFGYFESTRHTMVGLQHVAATDTPLDKYLVQADKSDLPADFVTKNPTMNLSTLVHHVPNTGTIDKKEVKQKLHEIKESLDQYPILEGIDDRISQYTNLDNSQLEAVHRILTKELAIIQGPPGTGKTFTSVQALRILIQSQERGSNIIVVAAQTNHAVDQILLQISNHGYDIVRLGGRTQSEEMKSFSLYNIRRRAIPRFVQKSDRDFRTFEQARKKNITALEKIFQQLFPDDVLNPGELLSAGIITNEQFRSLEGDDQWVSALPHDFPTSLMAQWLGPTQLVKVPPMDYKDPIFTVEEELDERVMRSDMAEAEDYNMELDDCVGDDDADKDVIRGTFVPIGHLWTGVKFLDYTEDHFIIRREMKRPSLWQIDHKYRGTVYRAWQKRLLEFRAAEVRRILADNKRITSNLKINRWYKDAQTIKGMRLEVIGCTTTGLTKYRGLLAALQPRTMLIEEAAETREANIISALYPSLQQLILVGDHQQLVPHCDTPGLAGHPFNLRVSLFERLVNLDMPFTMLNMQRRMIPTLRRVLNSFYPALQDHPVVTKPHARRPIPGMAVESFFFHHTWSESIDEDLSKYNVLEAEMVVGFIRYLRLNGVDDGSITVLTFYRGQRKKILTEARRNLFSTKPFTNVYTVDSYQGEENDIIILSLVRSNGGNKPPQAGFLADQNRGVVSISRARRGFYIFGNLVNLLRASDESFQMWGRVHRTFKEQGRVGEDGRLPVTCKRHGRTIMMSHPEEWVSNHGGCDLPCEETLPCGHPCGRRCHPMDHNRLICQKPCERQLRCGHLCQESCGKECRCHCSGFTGAYPDDEFEDVIPERTNQLSLDIAARASATPARRGTRGGYRGGRATFQSGRGRFGFAYETTNHPAGTSHGNWTTYNAREDDAEALQRAQQTAAESLNLIDLSDKATGSPEKQSATILRETFRPVTLTASGKRKVGGGIVSSGSGTPSPEKSKSSHKDAPCHEQESAKQAQSTPTVSVEDKLIALGDEDSDPPACKATKPSGHILDEPSRILEQAPATERSSSNFANDLAREMDGANSPSQRYPDSSERSLGESDSLEVSHGDKASIQPDDFPTVQASTDRIPSRSRFQLPTSSSYITQATQQPLSQTVRNPRQHPEINLGLYPTSQNLGQHHFVRDSSYGGFDQPEWEFAVDAGTDCGTSGDGNKDEVGASNSRLN